MTLSTAAELKDYLFGLTLHGIKLGLHNIAHLLEQAGNPQAAYPAVHVAGTNGKGSVLAFLHAMFRAADYSTARFTSPHLIDLNERILVNENPVTDAALHGQIAYFKTIADTMDPPPTFFEMTTAMAFRAFSEYPIDVALVEVGMGGRFDATNVINPVATAVTNIDLEHTEYLGNTLEAIAFEKAGIFKPGVPAVIGAMQDGPARVVANRATEVDAPATRAGVDFQCNLDESGFQYSGTRWNIDGARLGLPGPYQPGNAAVACALAESLAEQFPRFTKEAVVAGLADARWPCRMENVLKDPRVIIDVAHNVAGMRALVRGVDRCVAVVAIASDKDAERMLQTLGGAAERIILTRFDGRRAMPLEALAAAADGLPAETAPDLSAAIERGLALASDTLPLVITGSIYTAGEARKILIDRYNAPGLRF